MRNLISLAVALWWLSGMSSAHDVGKSMVVPMYLMQKEGAPKSVGHVEIRETSKGLLFTPVLSALREGEHGFHIHEKPSCEDRGMAAGPHFDPKKTKTHRGPDKNGHLGDLPRLIVQASGEIKPVVAPRLQTIESIKNHALMIHEGGDNYSDHPENGGGGGRMACGVIK